MTPVDRLIELATWFANDQQLTPEEAVARAVAESMSTFPSDTIDYCILTVERQLEVAS